MAATKPKRKRRVSQCKKTSQDGSPCTGKYVLSYEDNAPLFTCEVCSDTDYTWKTFYEEYLELWRDKEKWEEPKHKVSCVLGFFCYLYKEACGVDYVFVPNNPNPYSSKDCRDAHRLLAVFENDAVKVRKYLWWFFKKQFRPSMSIVSINYFNAPGLIRKYMLKLKKQATLTRASTLPVDFINWCESNTPEVLENYELTTMNDLGALLQFYLTYGKKETAEGKLIAEAERRNLIKNNKLCLGE